MPDQPAPRGTPRSGRGALVAAVVAAVAFAAAAAVLGILVASEDDRAEDLRRAAGEFAEVLVTYDHADPDAHRRSIVERATASFAAEYGSAFDEGLGQLITELQASSQGLVKDVYVTEVQRGQALAIAVLDVETDGTTGPRRLFDVYVRLTMIELDGDWLVDDVTDLSFGGGPGPLPDVTGTTTPTTAPSIP